MPVYTYFCSKCKTKFEIFCSIKEYKDVAACSSCNRSEHASRLYVEDVSTLHSSVRKSSSELKTVGDLAKRNTEKMSNDQKQSLYMKHNDYKHTEIKKELPKGMSRMKKSPKTQWPTG